MKKMHIFKALFAATVLALALPSCSDIGEEITAQTQVTKDGKVAVSLSVREDFRSIISAVSTDDLAYSLTITDTLESTEEGYEAPQTIALSNLTGTVAYLTADKTYKFALTGYAKDSEGNATETAIIETCSAVQKKITASDATVSLTLKAVEGSTVQVSLTVNYTTGYGVSDVSAVVYDDSALKTASDTAKNVLALSNENARNNDKTDGNVEFTGTIATGSTKWVKITLNDGTKDIGSKTVALYGIPTGDLAGEETVAVKEYKVTVNLTADTKPESLTLKNPAVTTAGYTGISVTTESTTNPYVFTAYVPVGTYDVYNGETLLGQVATSTTPLIVNTSVSLTGVAAAWKTTQPTLYVGGEGNEDAIKAALTVTATLSTGDEAVTNYTLNFDNTTAGEQTATISYAYNGKTETATVTLILTAVELESIAVDSTSSLKTEYTEGDELDLTGLVLALTYNDMSKNTTVAYTKPDAESGEAGNVNDFAVTVYSDSECTTPVTGAFSELGVADYYVKVTYAELTTAAIQVKVAAGSTYILKADSAIILLEKTYFGTRNGSASTEINAKKYLSVGNEGSYGSSTDSNKESYGGYTGDFYNLTNNASRFVSAVVKDVAAFTVSGYIQKDRGFYVTVNDDTEARSYVNTDETGFKTSQIFYTGSTDMVTIKLTGFSSNTIYPVCITVYSETAVLNFVKAEFEALKATVADITESQYWSGYNDIVEKRDVDTTDYTTVAQYNAAISALQSAINAAVKYIAPTAITVTYADTPVENGAELSFSKASGNTLTLTAKENEGSTGSLTWTVEGIEGISKEVSVTDGVSTCVISGIESTGTINVTVEDTRASLSKAFTITVTANVVKVEADDVIDVTVSATNAIMDETLELTATPAKSYSEAVTYQWYKNGKELEDATTPTLSYTTKDGDAGSLVFTFKVTGADATATGTASAVAVKNLYKFDFEKDTNTSYAIDTSIFSTSTKLFTLVAKEKLVNIETDKSSATAEDDSGYIFTKAAVGGDSKSYLSLTASYSGKVTIYFTSTDSSFASKDQSKSAKIQIDGNDVALSTTGNLSNTTAYVYSWNIEKGTTYKVDNNGSNRLALFGVTFEPTAPTNTTISVSHDIPTKDIALVVSGQTATVTLPEGVSETDNTVSYEWLVDGYVQPSQNESSYILTEVYYLNGTENKKQDIVPGDSFVVTARVTIDGIVYTKTASVLYIGN